MNPEDHTVIRKLDEILEILKRLDARQQAIKAEIEQEIKEQPVTGSFASSEMPKERERTGH